MTDGQKKLSFFRDSDDDEAHNGDSEDDFKMRVNTGKNYDKDKRNSPTIDERRNTSPSTDRSNFCGGYADNSQVNIDKSKINGSATAKSLEPNLLDQDAKQRRLQEIRAQIQEIKRQIENESPLKTVSEVRGHERYSESTIKPESSHHSIVESDTVLDIRSAGKKGRHRERETLELLGNFKKKLKKTLPPDASSSQECSEFNDKTIDNLDELTALDRVDGESWLQHRFEAREELEEALDVDKESYIQNEKHSGQYENSDSHRQDKDHEKKAHRRSRDISDLRSSQSHRHRDHHHHDGDRGRESEKHSRNRHHRRRS